MLETTEHEEGEEMRGPNVIGDRGESSEFALGDVVSRREIRRGTVFESWCSSLFNVAIVYRKSFEVVALLTQSLRESSDNLGWHIEPSLSNIGVGGRKKQKKVYRLSIASQEFEDGHTVK